MLNFKIKGKAKNLEKKKKSTLPAYSLSRRCVLLSFWFATGLFSMLFAFMAWSRELSVSSRAS